MSLLILWAPQMNFHSPFIVLKCRAKCQRLKTWNKKHKNYLHGLIPLKESEEICFFVIKVNWPFKVWTCTCKKKCFSCWKTKTLKLQVQCNQRVSQVPRRTEGEIVLTTKERNLALKFRSRRSCLPKRKQGHDIVLAPEFVNSRHLGQLLIQLCITSHWQAGQGCQSTF